MKRECRKIERFLYLYREGELSDEERALVEGHIKTCARCRAIEEHLVSMERALAPARQSRPALEGGTELVDETTSRIARPGRRADLMPEGWTIADLLLRWARPALGFALLVAAALFAVQQSRDAMKIDRLEAHLRVSGSEAASAEQPDLSAAVPALKQAGIAGDPLELLRLGLPGIFSKRSGLFEELAARYPELSRVRLEDGIDERERKILETEGRAFLKDFESLLHEGVTRP